jgi:regulator of sigma E protease
METFLIKGGQLLLSLSILVVLHELGHFIPAKLFKTRVEKFYLFFNPWFSLFKVKKGETEYGLGWLPLGGYVKIAGMVDESMDKEQLEKDPEPWEYRAKPAWQRLVIILGGVTVNILLAFAIYSMTLFAFGERYLPNDNLSDGVWVVDSIAYDLGLRTGDKVLSVNGTKPDRFSEILPEMVYGGSMLVERNSEKLEISIPNDIVGQLVDRKLSPLLMPRIPFVISNIPDSSHNLDADLKVGDQLLKLNGTELLYFDQYQLALKELSGQKAKLTIVREGERQEIQVDISEEGRVGVVPAMFSYSDLQKMEVYQFETKEYGFLEAIPLGISKGVKKLGDYWKQLKLIADFSTGAYKGVGSFGTMGKLFSASWNWQVFWEMTALLSIILAVMNVLPIPALDGGHAMFIVFEMVSGRKPSTKFMEAAQTVGMVLLLLLMVYALGKDAQRFFF